MIVKRRSDTISRMHSEINSINNDTNGIKFSYSLNYIISKSKKEEKIYYYIELYYYDY